MSRVMLEHDNFRGKVVISPSSTEIDKFRISGRAYEPQEIEADSLHQALEKLTTGQVKLVKRTTPIKKSEKKSAQMKGLWEKIRAANPANGSNKPVAGHAKTGATGK